MIPPMPCYLLLGGPAKFLAAIMRRESVTVENAMTLKMLIDHGQGDSPLGRMIYRESSPDEKIIAVTEPQYRLL